MKTTMKTTIKTNELNEDITEKLKIYNTKMENELTIFIPSLDEEEDYTIYAEVEKLLKDKACDVLWLHSISSVIEYYLKEQKEYIYKKLAAITEKKVDIYKAFIDIAKEVIAYSKIDEECRIGA